MGKTRKRIVIDTRLLKQVMKERGWTYRDLAREAGMPNVKQAYDAAQGKGGLAQMAYLMDLGIPGLFWIEETTGGKRTRRQVQIFSGRGA